MSERLVIRTPDQRVRVFVSSTLSALAAERQAVRQPPADTVSTHTLEGSVRLSA